MPSIFAKKDLRLLFHMFLIGNYQRKIAIGKSLMFNAYLSINLKSQDAKNFKKTKVYNEILWWSTLQKMLVANFTKLRYFMHFSLEQQWGQTWSYVPFGEIFFTSKNVQLFLIKYLKSTPCQIRLYITCKFSQVLIILI